MQEPYPAITPTANAPWLEACATPPPRTACTPALSAGALSSSSARASRLPRPGCSSLHACKPLPAAVTPSRIPRRSLKHLQLPSPSEHDQDVSVSKEGRNRTLLELLSPSLQPGSLLALSASDDSTDRLADTAGPFGGIPTACASSPATPAAAANGIDLLSELLPSMPSEAVLQAISPRFDVSSDAAARSSEPLAHAYASTPPRATRERRPALAASPDNLLAIVTQADSTPEELERLAACTGLQRQQGAQAPFDLLGSVLEDDGLSDDDGEQGVATRGNGAVGFSSAAQSKLRAVMQRGSPDESERRSGSGTARGSSQNSFRSEYEEACSRVVGGLQ